jgi:hypothetical protein
LAEDDKAEDDKKEALPPIPESEKAEVATVDKTKMALPSVRYGD